MRVVVVLCFALSTAGCATVVRGTTEPIAFTAEPPAAMTTDIGLSCPQTPCTLEVSRKQDFVAIFSAPGHEDQEIPVKASVSGAGAAGMAGNVLVGGVIGMGVDAATGATLTHQPNPVHASLVPLALPSAQRARRAPRGRPVS